MGADSNPLGRLPDQVAEALIAAGWKPGVPRRHTSQGGGRQGQSIAADMSDGFPGATKVLDELFGLKIAPLTRRGPLVPMTVAFTLEHLDADWQSQIRRLAELLQVPLCAIGNTGRWSAFLLLAETGFVFELGFAAYGLYLIGTSLGDALRRVLTGEVGVPVEFSSEQDPDGLFRRERSVVDDLCPNLVAIHPTVSSGIRDIQPRFLDDGRHKADRLGDGG